VTILDTSALTIQLMRAYNADQLTAIAISTPDDYLRQVATLALDIIAKIQKGFVYDSSANTQM